ncbi:tyrosine-type recombinase/integrase [Glaciimonas sp. GG7]
MTTPFKFAPIDLRPAPVLALPFDQRAADGASDSVEHFEIAPDAITSARTDSEIAREYLDHGELAATSRANSQKELFRFLTWCREEAHKPLRALRVADLNTYKEFLKKPPPDWVSITKWPRTDPRYRPFSGPLSDASRRLALVAVKGLLAYATRTGYLRRDAGALIKNIKTSGAARITRYLTQSAIDNTLRIVESRTLPSPAAVKRQALDRFLLLTYATTGARLSEIVGATMGSIYMEANDRWWIDVIGKGAKPRRLPVEPTMLLAFRQYRIAFALPSHTDADDKMPLVLSTRCKGYVSVTDETIGKALKTMFGEAARQARKDGDLDTAQKLDAATAHWLRHSMLTFHANNDVQLKTLQLQAGHANITTTASYLHKLDNERHDELLKSRDSKNN